MLDTFYGKEFDIKIYKINHEERVMRRICCIIIVLVMLIAAVNVAWAKDVASPSPAISTDISSTFLTIDNINLYPGMDKPYSNGYTPTVANGTARIVLPVVSAQELQGDRLNMTVDLGDAKSSPFIFSNYDKTIVLDEHTVNDGKQKVNTYLVELTLPLIENRVNGRYPLTVNFQGHTTDGAPVTQAFVLYVTISDGIDPDSIHVNADGSETDNPDTGSSTESNMTVSGGNEEAPSPQPKAMISSYTLNPAPMIAGQASDLSVTILNTSDSQSMDNVKITINGESSDIIPMGETNSFYFKKIGKKSSVTIDTKLMIQQTAEPKPQKLTLHIEYEGDMATAYTSDESITFQVKQPMRVEYDEPEIPKEVNAGDTMSISMNIMNMGRGTVYNVRAELEAPGLVPEGSLFFGNLESGASKKNDLYVFVGTLNGESNAESSDSNYGPTSGKITLTYEDEFGEVTTQVIDFSTEINPPVINVPQEEDTEDEPQTQSQWWISVSIIAVIIASIFIGYYINKKHKAKKGGTDEDI